MFAQAIYATDERRCQRGEAHDFGTVLRAMTGGRGGPGGGHGRGRHRGFGPGVESGYGGFPFGGPGRGPRGRGRKARRGDIRTAALLLLAEEPRNGYQIMQEVEERSEGVWRPSPGSVYPALAQLEDEGLIRSEEIDGRKLFAITDEGRAQLEQRDADLPAPWEQMSGDVSTKAHELGRLVREVATAFSQVVRTGSEAQMAKAGEVLATARRDLYRILADGEPEGTAGDDDA
jgi:DNA-binding PadR family transcriptional regulator